jgi:hypothetical protein
MPESLSCSRRFSMSVPLVVTSLIGLAYAAMLVEQHRAAPGAHANASERRHASRHVPPLTLLLFCTAVTGFVAALRRTARLLSVFLCLALCAEFVTLVTVVNTEISALRQCADDSESIRVTTSQPERLPPHVAGGPHRIRTVVTSSFVIDEAKYAACDQRARHHAVAGCLVLGLIFGAISCAGSRLMERVQADSDASEAAAASCCALPVVPLTAVCGGDDGHFDELDGLTVKNVSGANATV